MKRIYTLLALLAAFTMGATAQTRNVDLQLIHAYIDDTLVVDSPNVNDYFIVQYGIINLGPDTLKGSDTLVIRQLSANDAFGFYFFNDLAPGDTAIITPDTSNFEAGPANGNFSWCDSLSILPKPGDVVVDPTPNNALCTTVFLLNKTVTSVKELNAILPSVNLYPNPASDVVTFEYDFGTKANAAVIVRDMSGKVVYNNNLAAYKGTQKVTVPVANLSTGMYMLELSTSTGRSITRFSVKH